jgi:hypothetical protein
LRRLHIAGDIGEQFVEVKWFRRAFACPQPEQLRELHGQTDDVPAHSGPHLRHYRRDQITVLHPLHIVIWCINPKGAR